MSSIHVADPKAPRWNMRTFREKIISKEVYQKWIVTTGEKIDFDTFKKIWKLIALQIYQEVMEEPNGVLLPFGIGTLYTGWVKPLRKPIDYKTSKDTGKLVFFDNFHSYGKVGKIIYAPCGKYALKLCKWWGFTPLTPFKHKIRESLKENPERYMNSKQKMYKYGGPDNWKTNFPTQEPSSSG